ncbi:UdgX family uracil-DNA binding protein [Tianweitania sediminis]|uniref:Type-4 uracil-DNA glycosylase n=1 Tax=Tianweitania sediminis TaxID=1502156 RepID=A0A8J7QZH9_9HYPH|nr:UdgX family uracil-DNA binding protein [Tianweitania sediminis]MBP0438197.1 UdgX family uracil-DNA binding protein [Tianweitania sediminis]
MAGSAQPYRHMQAMEVLLEGETDFAGWRDAARRLALNNVAPETVTWSTGRDGDLFGSRDPLPEIPAGATMNVPRDFIDLAELVTCHSEPQRFALLYRILSRLRSEPDLLKIASDTDVIRLNELAKAVRRDIHKMRAFVRFRKIEEADGERYVSWFEPQHYIVERNAAFFVRRFTGMRWTILTPYLSADWDGEDLRFGPGANRSAAPSDDDLEALWKTYYANIFNPARLKVKAMQAEMPKKYWRNLPEAALIPDLIAGADKSAQEMIARMPTIPAPHHETVRAKHWSNKPEAESGDGADASSIAELRDAAKACRRCPLWADATQTVFGEGPEDARIVFVGEQPGDQEDLAGKPFVGPAGKVFDGVLEEAGVDRSITYVTNGVKHFKFEPRGKRRIHSKPNAGEISACRWWLDHELALIKPDLAVAMGATAAQSLLGKSIAVTKMRGQVVTRDDGLRVFLTIHPSFILRIPDPSDKEAERERFVADMRAVKQLMAA